PPSGACSTPRASRNASIRTARMCAGTFRSYETAPAGTSPRSSIMRPRAERHSRATGWTVSRGSVFWLSCPPEASMQGQLDWSRASFLGSLVPMVIADDRRRFVAANPAACLLLRLAEADVVRLRVDDLTPPENRSQMDALWEAFLRDRVQEGTFELMMPDGARLEVEYSATAHVEPRLHVSILMFPPGEMGRDLRASDAR